ncbi:DUF1573 domain-containing protein [Echinicola strongylocentroti]|uniref:DUF1573 domain-containing protein n=1 Tax=Echinicola strongylocentroti TaxID=1795355 RepID=A0A2Z4IQG8_9BACT|nr:DUF1573 domain-containing protein [Echinicola strongylocentroti]AWW32543.1 DUF1573 domain-containing protein [Echinicola strongylocentroti]
MKNILFIPICLLISVGFSLPVHAQAIADSPLIWERQKASLGSVMEEYGKVTTEFFVVNDGTSPVVIEEVETDCGCTTVDFITDTLLHDQIGAVKVDYQPTGFGGTFEKKVVVKTNIKPAGDTLYLEGFNIPYPENVASYYDYKVGNLGFRFSSINMGEVFTNAPKVKYVDFYNFKDLPITLDDAHSGLPPHVKINMIPAIVPAKSRGLLAIQYDGAEKDDLGFFDEEVTFQIESSGNEGVALRLLTTVQEYFAPVPKSEVNQVPRLGVSEVDVDLGKISSKELVQREITLSNMSPEPVNIRKVVTNCDCMQFDLPTYDLEPGEKTTLKLSFDPSGRLGIDHKMVSIFSNDPLNPTRTIVVKSRID